MARIVPVGGRRTLYRDTEGRWDELRHDGPRFTGFAPVGGKNYAEAIALASGRVG